jgi:hypothetical protein
MVLRSDRSAFALAAAALLALGSAALAANDGQIYWTRFDSSPALRRANLDGSGRQTLPVSVAAPWPIVVNPARGKIYWGDLNANVIRQANLDGTGVATLPVGIHVDDPGGLALDPSGRYLYWSDFGDDRICRTDLQTNTTVALITNLSNPAGLAVDAANGQLYWASFYPGRIQRASLNGTGVVDLVTDLNNPRDIALDLAAGRMYWPDLTGDAIYSADLDGSAAALYTSTPRPNGVAIADNHLYWACNSGIGVGDLNGSNTRILISDSSSYGLDVVPEPAGLLVIAAGLLVIRRRQAVSTRCDRRRPPTAPSAPPSPSAARPPAPSSCGPGR